MRPVRGTAQMWSWGSCGPGIWLNGPRCAAQGTGPLMGAGPSAPARARSGPPAPILPVALFILS